MNFDRRVQQAYGCLHRFKYFINDPFHLSVQVCAQQVLPSGATSEGRPFANHLRLFIKDENLFAH